MVRKMSSVFPAGPNNSYGRFLGSSGVTGQQPQSAPPYFEEFKSDVGTLDVRLRCLGAPVAQHLRLEELAERQTELSAHRTVENEVDGPVKQR